MFDKSTDNIKSTSLKNVIEDDEEYASVIEEVERSDETKSITKSTSTTTTMSQPRSSNSDNEAIGFCLVFFGIIGILLTIVLVPLNFSYLEYYQYGLLKRKTSGKVYTDQVYTRGRYSAGPTYTFIKYQADAHLSELTNMSVFSAGSSYSSVGLTFYIDIFLTYLLIKEEIGLLHQEVATSYEVIIESRAIEAIRNEAINIPFEDYFKARESVEAKFRHAVEKRWNSNPVVHAKLDQFYLGKVSIPETVADRQLETRVQNERNDKELYLQQAQVVRDQTDVEVNQIHLQASRITQIAQANADLLVANAQSNATKLTRTALNNGTLTVIAAAGIKSQEQKIAYLYIQSLLGRNATDLQVNYLTDDNLVKVTAV